MADTGKATHDFYAAFESHTCDEDTRQATARTISRSEVVPKFRRRRTSILTISFLTLVSMWLSF